MKNARFLCVFSLAWTSCWAQQVGNVAAFASGKPLNLSKPGAVAVIGDTFQQTVWVSYTNGADSAGGAGSSTVVEYNIEGRPLHRCTIPGSVDGLKENPAHSMMWALQNQNGNSSVTIISPEEGTNPLPPIPYAVESATRGYRDVAFYRHQALLSYTHPASPTDPTIQEIVGMNPPLPVSDVLLAGATGTNIATGETNQPTSQVDPGSLRITPWDAVMLVSGSNGQLIFVQNVDSPQQSVEFLNVLDTAGHPASGVSDALFPEPGQNLFFISNASTNLVLVVYIFDIAPGQLLALVDSMNALVKIDLRTGVATPLLGNLAGYQRMASLQISGEVR